MAVAESAQNSAPAVLHMLLPEDDINPSFVYNRVAPLSRSDLLDLEDKVILPWVRPVPWQVLHARLASVLTLLRSHEAK